MDPGALAKACGREPVTAAKSPREVRPRAVAHESPPPPPPKARRLGEQLHRHSHAPLEKVLVKAHLSELRIRALQLARLAGERGSDRQEREPAPVVAGDHDAR